MSSSSSHSGRGRIRRTGLPSQNPASSSFLPSTSGNVVGSSDPALEPGCRTHPASPTAEALIPKRSRPSMPTTPSSVPALEQPFPLTLGETMANLLQSLKVACIREFSGEESLQEDIETVMGTLERLTAWFSDMSTVSFIHSSSNLAK